MAAFDVARDKKKIGPATGLAADLQRRLDETGAARKPKLRWTPKAE